MVVFKGVKQLDIINFVENKLIWCFKLLEILIIDWGIVFTSWSVKDYAKSKGIKILRFAPYYA